jgi:hypothetical protein
MPVQLKHSFLSASNFFRAETVELYYNPLKNDWNLHNKYTRAFFVHRPWHGKNLISHRDVLAVIWN